ncbi:VPS37 family protein [Abortiporus biennis]
MSTQLLADYPQLSQLSREDLEDLLTDPRYFDAVFHSLPQVKALYQAQAELGSANEAIAKNTLTLQEPLFKLRADTQAAFEEAKQLEARWKELEREQREVYQRFTPQFLLMRLKHATTAQDELSEALASSFVHGTSPDAGSANAANGKDVDDFVKEFKELRKTYHKRVIWGDRWSSGQVS